MVYLGNLTTNQQLYIANQGNQTTITLMNSSQGQQQSQSFSFLTGAWTAPPTLLQKDNCFIVRIDTAQEAYFVQVQGNELKLLTTAPNLIDADVMGLEKIDETKASAQNSVSFEPMKPMEQMKPMRPMNMGDMSMNMKPMAMRMGDMYLEMPSHSQGQSSSEMKPSYCTQCGSLVKADDRFCGNCGHQLKD